MSKKAPTKKRRCCEACGQALPRVDVELVLAASATRNGHPCPSVYGILVNVRTNTVEYIGGAFSVKRAVLEQCREYADHKGWAIKKVVDRFKGKRVLR